MAVRLGFSEEGMCKQMFEYEKNLPCDDIRILPSRKTRAQVLRRK